MKSFDLQYIGLMPLLSTECSIMWERSLPSRVDRVRVDMAGKSPLRGLQDVGPYSIGVLLHIVYGTYTYTLTPPLNLNLERDLDYA